MTPAEALDKLLPRWRRSLPTKYTPEFIDSFIARKRDALETVVARATSSSVSESRACWRAASSPYVSNSACFTGGTPRLTFGLIHEYYTPQTIADAIAAVLCPLLVDVAGHDGIVRALEPSAGIGRLIRAFTPRQCLALEASGQVLVEPSPTPEAPEAPAPEASPADGQGGQDAELLRSFTSALETMLDEED